MGKEAGAAAGGDLKAGSPSTFALSLARGPFLLAPARLLEGWSNPWGGAPAQSWATPQLEGCSQKAPLDLFCFYCPRTPEEGF